MSSCEAKQYSDQMFCDRCGLVWDMNDPDRPECVTDAQIKERRDEAARKQCGIEKGVLVITLNGTVYKVSSFKGRELGKPLLRGYRRLKNRKFAKRSSEIYGDWDLLPRR